MGYNFFIAILLLLFEVIVAGPCSSREANERRKDSDAPEQACLSVHRQSAIVIEEKKDSDTILEPENNDAPSCRSVSPTRKVFYHSPFELKPTDFNTYWYFHKQRCGVHQRPSQENLHGGKTLRPSLRHVIMTRDVHPYEHREFALTRAQYVLQCQLKIHEALKQKSLALEQKALIEKKSLQKNKNKSQTCLKDPRYDKLIDKRLFNERKRKFFALPMIKENES